MGSIYKRGSNYYIRFKDQHGKWVARAASTREDEAKRMLREVERGIRDLPRIAAPEVKEERLSDLTPDWLERRTRRGLRNVAGDRVDLDKHLLPQLGSLPVREIRPRHIRACVETLQSRGLAPRTVRRIYGTLHKLFADLLADEMIDATPCVLTSDQLPKNRDKDLTWRPKAIFVRDEVELLISSDAVPLDRRVFYAVLFFTGVRLGEAAGLRWSDIDHAAVPLKRLTVSRSYESDTKTQTARDVPVHPVLAAVLAEWKSEGFVALVGHHARPGDFIVPSRNGVMRSKNQVRGKFLDDLARLGMRHRRVHDTRRTFITLARVDGARKDVLEPITHSGRGGIMDVYTSLPWATLCEAVVCLKLERIAGNVYRLPLASSGVNVTETVELPGEPNNDMPIQGLVTKRVTSPESRARYVQNSWKAQDKLAEVSGGGAGSRTRVRK